MNRHQRRRAASEQRKNGSPVHPTGRREAMGRAVLGVAATAGLITPGGQPVATLEQRCWAELAQLLRMAARELDRQGIDIRRVLAAAPPRGMVAPVYVEGRWLLQRVT